MKQTRQALKFILDNTGSTSRHYSSSYMKEQKFFETLNNLITMLIHKSFPTEPYLVITISLKEK